MLNADERSALASLRAVWPDTRIVLIGASALRFHGRLERMTYDLDLVIAMDLPDFPGASCEPLRLASRHARSAYVADLVWLFEEHYLDEQNDSDFERLISAGEDTMQNRHALLLGRDIAEYPDARERARRFFDCLRAHAYVYGNIRSVSLRTTRCWTHLREASACRWRHDVLGARGAL
jgi:hypothetical protein